MARKTRPIFKAEEADDLVRWGKPITIKTVIGNPIRLSNLRLRNNSAWSNDICEISIGEEKVRVNTTDLRSGLDLM